MSPVNNNILPDPTMDHFMKYAFTHLMKNLFVLLSFIFDNIAESGGQNKMLINSVQQT